MTKSTSQKRSGRIVPFVRNAFALAALLVSAGVTETWAQDFSGRPDVTGTPTPAAGNVAGAGGGSMADFSQLMMLIQTTIEPETWEALGGTSTMFPYAAGITVDPRGTIRDVETPAEEHVAAEIKMLLARDGVTGQTADADDPDAWRMPSKLRRVSLKRLLDTYARHRDERRPSSDAMLHLGGLSRIQFVHFTADDIVLAGEVGGVQQVDGRPRDRKSGAAMIRLDALAGCFAAVAQGHGFGCSIDPTPLGLQRAAKVAAQIQAGDIPRGQAAAALGDAIGPQDVRVRGVPADSSLAWLMVEADRHLKQLALGRKRMPDHVTNYLDQIENHIDRGVPTDLLLRLWFTSQPMAARQSVDGSVVEFAGRSIRLSGQNERAVASGQRGLMTEDPRTAAFVDDFNKNWSQIRAAFPVYASLESVFNAAALAQLVQIKLDADQAPGPAASLITQAFASIASSDAHGFRPPKRVESLAVSHSLVHAKQRHHIVVASGGVEVDPLSSLRSDISTYPPLAAMRNLNDDRPADGQRWWWDR